MLATNVKTVTVDWTDGEHNPAGQPESDIKLFTAAASSLSLANPYSLADPFASAGGQVVLLLHLLHRLHRLTVIPARDPDQFAIFMSMQHLLPPTMRLPVALQSLSEVVWYTGWRDSGVTPTILLSLLKLPRIRMIDVQICSIIRRPFPASNATIAAIGTSPVTHLELSFSGTSSWRLTPILLIPRALTHFTYRTTCGNHIAICDLRQALVPLQSTLQHLYLDLFESVEMSEYGARQKESLGSFREWSVLRHLGCSLIVLLAEDRSRLADVLPSGLQTLETVFDPFWKLNEVVREVVVMLERKHEMVPCLRQVGVHLDTPKSPEMMEWLTGACQVAGVELVE